MPEEMLVDAPAEETAVESSSEGSVETSSEGAEGSESVENQGLPTLAGSALWRDLKGPLYSGKSLTKQQISSLKRAIQDAGSISERYPDGIGQLETGMAQIQQLATEQGQPIEKIIADVTGERDHFRTFDDLYTKGDAKAVDWMLEAGPEYFDRFAPHVIRKFAETNPQAYSQQMAQSVLQHMNSAEVPLQYSILKAFLPQLPDGPAKDQIIQACESLFAHFSGLKTMATQKLEEKPLPQANQAVSKPQDGQFEMVNLKRENWNLSTLPVATKMVTDAANREVQALKKSGLTEQEQQAVIGKVSKELDYRLGSDQGFKTAMHGYLNSNDRNAWNQRISSERKRLIPEATRRAVQDVLAERPAKAAVKPGAPAGKPNGQAKPLAGAIQFRKISGPPKTLNLAVDLNRTPQSMLVRRQAYLKGEERPVTWG